MLASMTAATMSPSRAAMRAMHASELAPRRVTPSTSMARLRIVTSSSDARDGTTAEDVGRTRAIRALVPSFLAIRRGSRFAHQEFVARAAEAYRLGATVQDARIEAAMMGLSSVIRLGMSEQDAFASSVAMVHLTMRFMGEKGGRAGSSDETANEDEENVVNVDALMEEADPEARGMLKYIEATHKSADAGYTLKRMELERRFAGAGLSRSPSPGEALMRSNCKLTLLTREMLELERGVMSARLALTAAEEDSESISASVDDVESESQAQVALAWCRRDRTPARELAAEMLVGFFSVLTGHPLGYKSFVAAARAAFEKGISADEITSAVEAPEFDVEGTRRGMFGRSADAPKLFAGFVTTAYIALEAEGLALPPSANGDEELFAYADYPCAPDDVECKTPTTDELKRRSAKGLRQAIDAWLAMDRDTLADEVSLSLSEDEGDEDMAKPVAKSTSAKDDAKDDSFVVIRDDNFAASSITLAAMQHQRNIVSFAMDSLATATQAH
jgi:hypothetical protein